MRLTRLIYTYIFTYFFYLLTVFLLTYFSIDDAQVHWRIQELKLVATPFPFLSLPSIRLSSPFLPFPSSFVNSPLFPYPSFSLIQLPAVSSLSGVRGRGPATNAFLTILTSENASGDNRFSNFTCILVQIVQCPSAHAISFVGWGPSPTEGPMGLVGHGRLGASWIRQW